MRGIVGNLILAAPILAGCSVIGAREVDRTPDRPISADISASLYHGPTATQPGITTSGATLRALP